MWLEIIGLSIVGFIIWCINYMILSNLFDVDVDDREYSSLFVVMILSIVGLPLIIPIALLAAIFKPILLLLEKTRDAISIWWEDEFLEWCGKSWVEKKRIRKEKNAAKKAKREAQSREKIKLLEKEIVSLNQRIAELNKFTREEAMDI